MRSVVAAAVLILLVGRFASSMPLRPELVERLRKEGRIEEARETLLLEAADLEERAAAALPGSIKVLVLLVDFDDMPADTILHSRPYYQQLLFSRDFKWSLRNYYDWSSYGGLDITGEIYGWFRVGEPLSYYADDRRGMGRYPKNAQKMIEEAVDIADNVVDFSRFDNDGPDGIPSSGDDDGFVDYLCVVHGGQGYEWTMNPGHIHSHVSKITARELDGVWVKAYATEPEDGKVGTFAHELGHLFGLPDLYDVTLSTYGLGMWSLMSYGSWGGGDGSRPIGLDAWCKMKLGFLEPVTLDDNVAGLRLACIEDGPHAVRLWSKSEDGPQYFLVENRRHKSWDSFLGWFGQGLLVYHVDERLRDNSTESKHLVSLEQADGRFDLEKQRDFGFGSDGGDPFPGSTGKRRFSWSTTPSNYSNEGSPTQVSLRNISDPGDTMTFDAEVWSPIILFDSYSIDDRDGDHDHEPDPGEEIVIEIRLRNHGISSRSVNVSLITDDPHIDPPQALVSLDSIPEMSLSTTVRFSLAVDESIPEPYDVEFMISIDAVHAHGGYSSEEGFVMAVPLRRLAGWPVSAGSGISAPISIADLDNDGIEEVIAGCSDRHVYAWRLDGSLAQGWPVATGGVVASKPAVCDIDIDGRQDVIVTAQDGRVYAFRNDGVLLPGWPQTTGGTIRASPMLADIDDDGMVEIISGSDDGKMYAWDEDGRSLRGWPVALGGSKIWMSPAAGDIDGDHLLEVIVGGYGDPLYVIDGDGRILDGWPIPVGRGCGNGSPAVADIDGDGLLDIAVSGLFANSIYVVGIDGKTKSGWPRWSYNCGQLSAPIPADIDNDGLPEIAVSTSCGTIVAWNADGSYCKAINAKGNAPIVYCEPVFADLDGNGTMEGLFGTAGSIQSEVDAFGADGRITGFPIPVSGDVWSTAAVGDMDNDGYIEVVVATTAGEVNVWRFVGAKGKGRVEYSQSRGDLWNTGIYGFTPNANVPLADLALSSTDISLEPEKPKVGDLATVKVIVRNVGHWVAEDFAVNLYADALNDTLLMDSVTIDRLGAKTDTVLSFTWLVPGGSATRLIYAGLDTEDEVLELSELNNQAGRRFYLSLADLVARISRIEPFPITVGDSVTVFAAIENAGTDVARGFTLALYDSAAREERRFASFQIDSLAPGEAKDVSAKHAIPRFGHDFLRIWAVADPYEQVLEYHLSNNAYPFDINSGIAGDVLAVPVDVSVSALRSSRRFLAMQASQWDYVLVSESSEPFELTFETVGRDLDLSRSTVVFSQGGDIVGFDIRDSVFFVVSTEPEEEIQPVIWGDNIAWIAKAVGTASLRLKDAFGEVKTIRAVSDGQISNPDLSHDVLVWEENRGQDTDLLAYDLESDTLIVVCDEDHDQLNPAVWGSVIIWEDHSRDGGNIVGLDLGSDRRLSIAEKEGLQRNPAISGDLVVWQDSRSGNWDIYAYGLTFGEEFPLCRQIDDQVMPTIADSTVFWVDLRNPEGAVRGLRFGGERLVASVRKFEALSQDGQIKLLVSVKEHEDGITYRFYRYPDDRPMPHDRHKHIRLEFDLSSDSIYAFADTSVAARREFFYTLGVIDGYGEESFYGPVGGSAYQEAPKRLVLGPPAPNPCRGHASIGFGVPRTFSQPTDGTWPDPVDDISSVTVGVYSVTGRLVRTLKTGNLVPGYYGVIWDGRNDQGTRVSSGVYIVHASVGGHAASQKIILIR